MSLIKSKYLFLRFLQSKYFLPVCGLVSLLCRIGWIYFVRPEPVADAKWYYERSLELAAGNGYVVDGQATAFWPVGYPAFLALLFSIFGESLLCARIANVLLYLGILFLAYYIAKQLFHSELIGRLTFLALSFYPNHITYSSLMLSETLFLFLLLSGIALLICARSRIRMEIFAGVIFGFACLVKPIIILLPGVIYFADRFQHRRIFQGNLYRRVTSITILYAALLAILAPWLVRNYTVFDKLVFVSTNGGYNLLQGNNQYAYGSSAPFDKVDEVLQQAERESPAYQVAAGNEPLTKAQQELRLEALSRKTALEYILNHPLQIIQLLPKKIFYLYRDDAEGLDWNIWGIEERPFPLHIKALWKVFLPACRLCYWATWLFMAAAMGMLWRERKIGVDMAQTTLGLWIIAYFTLIYLVFYGETRYHFPMIPWFVMYASMTVSRFLMKSKAVEDQPLRTQALSTAQV